MRLFVNLRRQHMADGIRGEIAKLADEPVNVLQTAIRHALGPDAQQILQLAVPCLEQIGGFEAAFDDIALKLEAVAAKAGFAKTDELFAAFARDEIHSKHVQSAIQAVAQPPTTTDVRPPEPEVVTRRSRATTDGHGILVVGVDRLLTGLARCCKPAPPDPIVGFVTRGKGITIHRAACANVARIRDREPERLIEAGWGAPREQLFPVDIVVEASDRQGLLRDISELLTREKINVTAVNTQTRQHQARMAFTLEVESIGQLKRALQLARDIPGVFVAERR